MCVPQKRQFFIRFGSPYLQIGSNIFNVYSRNVETKDILSYVATQTFINMTVIEGKRRERDQCLISGTTPNK